MRSILSIIRSEIKNRPGFYLLLFILITIAAVTIKPGFYLLGWDNYSSYFNLSNNIFQTFFATWREYRGLGVPSDSESVDLFRQVFYFILHFFTPEKLLDQIYNCFVLFVGGISMYYFSSMLFKKSFGKNLPSVSADWFGFFAALFYIFNLNTLSTFYFPMIMYVNRFFMLPLVFGLIFVLLKEKLSLKMYLFVVVAFLFSSGAFLTATIFITLLIGLVLYGLSMGQLKKYFFILIIFIATQLFWLLPFFNYTIQKSKIIPLAPAYIATNEVQLNKAQNSYSLVKTLTLYPSFFDTQFSNITKNQILHFHPMAVSFGNPVTKSILLLFPTLYILGSIIVVIKRQRYRFLTWVPASVAIFIFLTLKEFSPLGFLYHSLDQHIPYFGILFRFGDTKFHPMIVFAGSIAAAVSIIELLNLFKDKRKYVFQILIGAVALLTIFAFKFYLTGSLISPYKYVSLPNAYLAIAKTINEDPSESRVLFLPFGKEDYWKSYSWGMFGSSFLNFMLDHPLFDKTFEPASQENVLFDSKIDKELRNFQLIQNPFLRREKAEAFASILRTFGVRYLIYDSSVESSIYSRGVLLWQRFNSADSKEMINELIEDGFAAQIKKYDIDLMDYLSTYDRFHKLTEEEKSRLIQNSKKYALLVEIKNPDREVSFLDHSITIDPKINILDSRLVSDNHGALQLKESTNFITFPFLQNNKTLTQTRDSFILNTNPSKEASTMILPKEPADQESVTHFIGVYVKKDTDNLILSFTKYLAPSIGEDNFVSQLVDYKVPLSELNISDKKTSLSNYASNWQILDSKVLGPHRLRIGDYIIPLPSEITTFSSKLGIVMVKGNSIPLEVLSFDKENVVDSKDVVITQRPNCFRDELQDAKFSIKKKGNEVDITNQNQSLCFVVDLHRVLGQEIGHAEFSLNARGISQDLDPQYIKKVETSKKGLTSYIRSLPKPNILRLCAKQPFINDCYNPHQLVNVTGNKSVIVPTERALDGISDMQLLLSLKNTGYQRQEIDIRKLTIDTFKTRAQAQLDIPSYSDFSIEIPEASSSLKIPKALSIYSFYYDPKRDGLYGFNPACEDKNGYRTFRIFEDKLVSYVSSCYIEYYPNVSFASSNFYLWDVKYNLLSGKYPRFIVDDGFYNYEDTFLSINQGYPSTKGFQIFRSPEHLLSDKSSSYFQKEFEKLNYQDTYGFIYPQPNLSDTGSKNVTVHQDSENEGIMLLSTLSFQPLPTQWVNVRLSPSRPPSQNYQKPKSFSFNRVLPSLWKVSVTGEGKMLLKFNEGFDGQWRLYDNHLGVILGTNGIKSTKCGGYANCFEIIQSGSKTYYIFYYPERLSVIGWVLTIIGILILGKLLIGSRVYLVREHERES